MSLPYNISKIHDVYRIALIKASEIPKKLYFSKSDLESVLSSDYSPGYLIRQPSGISYRRNFRAS